MSIFRVSLVCLIALVATPALNAGIIYGTNNTTPLTFDGTSVDSDLQNGTQFAIRFATPAAPAGLFYTLTGFAAALQNAFRASPISVTAGVYTAVPRTPATNPATQQPGLLLDSVTFNVLPGSAINVYTPIFAGGALLAAGTNYFLATRVNTTGGITQVDWAEALSGTQTVAVKSGSQPWVSFSGFENPAVQIYGDVFVAPEPSTLACAGIGILCALAARRKLSI